ncbi:hypothetical protein N8390_07840 [Amylibacter sp.]|nr:hypothetical protein [Amylibacter sp.]
MTELITQRLSLSIVLERIASLNQSTLIGSKDFLETNFGFVSFLKTNQLAEEYSNMRLSIAGNPGGAIASSSSKKQRKSQPTVSAASIATLRAIRGPEFGIFE